MSPHCESAATSSISTASSISSSTKTVASRVDASWEVVEDACSFAWVEFFRYQPDRDRNWKGWLVTVAKREAWRLNGLELREREAVRGEDLPMDLVDPRDRHAEVLEFRAAIEELRKLPPLLQEVVVIQFAGQPAPGRGRLDGSQPAARRVPAYPGCAAGRAAQRGAAEEERPVASPRAARLRELEESPPEWLTNAIGRRPGRTKSDSSIVLAWRRAAMVIDDFRQSHGWGSRTDAIGAIPIDQVARRRYQRAERAIADVAEARDRRKGVSRER